MAKDYEASAAAMLTTSPTHEYTLEKDGFIGALFEPADGAGGSASASRFPGKALVILGGGDGVYSLTKVVAERFSLEGMPALALAYWKLPGLPPTVASVPVEFVRLAARALMAQGYPRVGAWGISKGAELALVAASAFPDDISCVVAASPIDAVNQGIGSGGTIGGAPADARKKDGGAGLASGSSWTLGGRDLPFAPLSFSKARIFADCLRYKGVHMRSNYVSFEESVPEQARIRVENAGGPVLLLSAVRDDMWPADEACRRIIAKLDECGFPYEHLHLSYEVASHYLLPCELGSARMFGIERKHPDACRAAREDSTAQMLAFLERW